MALNDISRTKKTYSFFRHSPILPTMPSESFQLLSTTAETNLTSSTPKLIGNILFNSKPILNRTRTIIFKVSVSTTNASFPVYVQLYDKDGITGSIQLISSSIIGPTTDLVSTYYENDISNVLSKTNSSGVLELWMWMGSTSLINKVFCSMAKIDINWI